MRLNLFLCFSSVDYLFIYFGCISIVSLVEIFNDISVIFSNFAMQIILSFSHCFYQFLAKKKIIGMEVLYLVKGDYS